MPEPSPHEEGCICAWCLPRTVAQAKVGITALVDEATGYQDQRGEHELADLAEKIGRETAERVRRGVAEPA